MPNQVRELMTTPPVCLPVDAKVVDAAAAMRKQDIGDVIVTDHGVVYGIVTDRDIVIRGVAEERDLTRTEVGEICTKNPATIAPTEFTHAAVKLMCDEAVRRLPVVENGEPVGVITLGDLALEPDGPKALAGITAAPPDRQTQSATQRNSRRPGTIFLENVCQRRSIVSAPSPVARAHKIGQSIWLDYLSRKMLQSGKLTGYLSRGLRGVTSNPKIFDQAMSEGSEYDDSIQRLAREGKSPLEIYETLAVEDVQKAADLLRPCLGKGLPQDGFVSLEVSPRIAHDTELTVDEARRLWRKVDRPNVMIKVPATSEGLPAIRQLTSEGINVNVTLLFGVPRYREVADAYLEGLEEAVRQGRSVESISSVASFFLSRIDVLVDSKLDEIAEQDKTRAVTAKELRGEIAIASAKLAYRSYEEILASERFQRLADEGAQPQRLLWGSTSSKDPSYSDVKYVNALVGPDTVNTLPEDTFEAFLDHGHAENVLARDYPKAEDRLERLQQLNIDLAEVTQQLIDEGVEKFSKPFNHLLEGLAAKKAA